MLFQAKENTGEAHKIRALKNSHFFKVGVLLL